MPKGIKVCKVCGCEYEYCKNMVPNTGAFRWQDVACCQEHGEQYLALVMKARGVKPASQPEVENESTTEVHNVPKKRSRKNKNDATASADKEMA